MFPDELWRLIPLLDAPGDLQMALDAWLFQQCAQGNHPPTLRFYTWSPPALSLGYHQRNWPQHWSSITWQGHPLDLVRRPTGGRAVLHQGDLTYSVVLSGLSGHRRQAYRDLCGFLIQGWQALGVSLHFGAAGGQYQGQSNCFALATDADLVTDTGLKLIGSAQAWQGSTVLQHGSIRLNPDPELWFQVFGESIQSPQTQVSELRSLQLPTLMDALTQAAQQYFQVNLNVQPLSAAEWARVYPSLDTSITGTAGKDGGEDSLSRERTSAPS